MPETDQVPDFLSYRPSQEQEKITQQIQAVLNGVANKIKTSNHLQALAVQKEQNFPLFQLLFAYTTLAQRDLLTYFTGLVSYLLDQQGGETTLQLAIDPELSDELIGSLDAADTGLEQTQALLVKLQEYLGQEELKNGEKRIELLEEVKRIDGVIKTIREDLEDASGSISDSTWEEPESEPEPPPKGTEIEMAHVQQEQEEYEPLLIE